MKRILCALPLPYGPNWGFWTRDSGLMVLALRDMGYDAWLVGLGDSSTDTRDRPVLVASLADLNRPEWWQAQRPDAVVLSTGSAPRHDGMRKAALAATPRVVERLDTDGIRSARLFPLPYWVRATGSYWDRLPVFTRWLAPLVAAAHTAVLFTFPQLIEIPMVRTMRRLPAVIAESPLAVERIQEMFEAFSGQKHHVAMIPHPVNETVMRYNGSERGNQIISVGRWNSFQKDYPLLRRVIKEFLERHPDWTACVVGGGVPKNDRLPGRGTEEWRNRVTFHEHLTHEQMVKEFNRSRIYLMVSRYEGFSVAASEALCCGCSVVSGANLASATYTAQDNSGAVATHRTAPSFLQSLNEEVACWSTRQRDPEAIAAIWRDRLGAQAVARATVNLLEEILP